MQAIKTPLEEIKPPRLCFQKIAIDIAGPYPETDFENRFVLTVIDMLSGYIEAFPLKDKQASTVAKCLLDEIFNRYSWPLEIVSDNGTENVNHILKELLELGHVHHVKTSPWHPRSNGRCERTHKTMLSCLAKVAKKNDWDQYIRSFCSAFNNSTSSSTGYSAFYLVYHRSPIIPCDTILQNRDKYYGESYLPTALQNMHRAYYLVRKRLQKEAERNRHYYNKRNKVQDVQYEVGSPVFLKNHQKQDKMDKPWLPHYRVLIKSGKYNYVIQHQVSGKTRRAHAVDLRLANESDSWDNPQQNTGKRQVRSATYDLQESDFSSDSDTDISDSDHSDSDEPEDTESVSQDSVKDDDNQTQTSDSDIPSSRPQRQAKTKALQKLKQVHEISTNEPPLEKVDDLINEKLDQKFQNFMQSFSQAFTQSMSKS